MVNAVCFPAGLSGVRDGQGRHEGGGDRLPRGSGPAWRLLVLPVPPGGPRVRPVRHVQGSDAGKAGAVQASDEETGKARGSTLGRRRRPRLADGLYTPDAAGRFPATGGSHGTSRRSSRWTGRTGDGRSRPAAADAGGGGGAGMSQVLIALMPVVLGMLANRGSRGGAPTQMNYAPQAAAVVSPTCSGRCWGRRGSGRGGRARRAPRAAAAGGLRRAGRLLGEPRRQQADLAGRDDADLRTRWPRADLAAGGDQRGRGVARPLPATSRGRRPHDSRWRACRMTTRWPTASISSPSASALVSAARRSPVRDGSIWAIGPTER